jgi:hypothetical protein
MFPEEVSSRLFGLRWRFLPWAVRLSLGAGSFFRAARARSVSLVETFLFVQITVAALDVAPNIAIISNRYVFRSRVWAKGMYDRSFWSRIF